MQINFAILGPGSISRRFAKVLNTAEGARLAAVASASSLERAENFAREFGADSYYGSYEELLRQPDIDAVYIGLTHNFHYDAIKLSLEHGKAVLCEKPMVTTEAEAKELTEMARSRGLLLMEAMWTRCLPAFRQARQWIADGRIGQTHLVQASFSFNVPFDPEHRLYNPALAGGGLFDAGVYPIEFASGILGENPNQTTGTLQIGATGVDEMAAMSLAYPSGALASLSCGLRTKTDWDGRVYGSSGSVIVRDFLMTKRSELYDAEGQLVDQFDDDFDDGFIYQINHFLSLLEAGRIESDLIPHRDTIACAAVFDQLLSQNAPTVD